MANSGLIQDTVGFLWGWRVIWACAVSLSFEDVQGTLELPTQATVAAVGVLVGVLTWSKGFASQRAKEEKSGCREQVPAELPVLPSLAAALL